MQSESYVNKKKEDENEIDQLNIEVRSLMKETMLSAQEMQLNSYIKKVSKLEKRFWRYKLKSKNDIEAILIIKEKLLLLKTNIRKRKNGSDAYIYIIFANLILAVGITLVCIKVFMASGIANLPQAKLGLFPTMEISIAVLNFMMTIFAGMFGFLTYLFSEIALKKDLPHAKLILTILFPAILAVLFKDISQSYALNMSATLCFIVGYNFKTLLLFTGKILEKVNNVIQRI